MADQKLTQLPQATGATPNDELYLVTDTSTTPVSKRITFDDLQKSLTDVEVTSIQFDTTQNTPPVEGQAIWNTDAKTLEIGLKGGFTLEVGHQLLELCVNKTGSNIAKGKVVYIDGGQGNRPTITLADYTSDATSARTFGITAEAINNNNSGYVITQGLVTGLNTNAYTAGTQLYLSTSGDMTSTKPSAPNHMVYVAKVITQSSSVGVIYVSVQNGVEIDEIHDVSITSISNKQFLVYNSTNTLYENKSISYLEGDITHNNLSGLTTGDPHTQYTLLAGRSGGQTINGDTAASGNLNLESTANATKGYIRMANPNGAVAIGLNTPAAKLHVKNNTFGNNSAPSGNDENGYTVASAPIQSAFFERGFVGLGDTSFTPKNRLDVAGAVVIGTNYAGNQASGDLAGLLVEGKTSIGTVNQQASLNVRGAGTTTARAFQVMNSSDTKLFVVRDDGNVGLLREPSNDYDMAINATWSNWTAATQKGGMLIANDISLTTAAQRFYRTLNFTTKINIPNAISATGYIYGFSADVTRYLSTDLGTLEEIDSINFAFGHESSLNASAKTTEAYGINIRPYHAKGTITNMYGLYIAAPVTGGTVTNPYAIYSAWNTDSYFAGNVGIGKTNPAAKLDITGSAYISGDVGIGTTAPSQKLDVNGRIRMNTWTSDGDTVAYRDNTTNCIALLASDRRLKKDLEVITNPIEKVKSITGYTYRKIDDDENAPKKYGVMAQDVLTVAPELTFEFTNENDPNTYYSVHYDKLPALLIEAIKEQQLLIENLQERVAQLENE